MDADLQDPPELIPEMLRYWQEGYDDVYATRRSRGKESWLRRRLSLSYYSLLQRTTHIPVLQNAAISVCSTVSASTPCAACARYSATPKACLRG